MPTSPSILLSSEAPDRSWDIFLPFAGFALALFFAFGAERNFALIDRIEAVSGGGAIKVEGFAEPAPRSLDYSYVWKGERVERSVICVYKGPCAWSEFKPGKISVSVDPKSGLSLPTLLLKRGASIESTALFNGWTALFLAGFSILGAFLARRFL